MNIDSSASYLEKLAFKEKFNSYKWDSFKDNDEYTKSYKSHDSLKKKALAKKDYVKSNYHQEVMSAILSERKKPSKKFKELTFKFCEKKYSKKQ